MYQTPGRHRGDQEQVFWRWITGNPFILPENRVELGTMTSLSKVLVVDDHPLFREALSTAVALVFPHSSCNEAASIEEALAILDNSTGFDIALVDLKMPGVSGFDGLIQLRTQHPRLPILVVSGLEDMHIVKEAMTFGAAGYVPKSVGKEGLGVAINTVLQGDIYLPEQYKAQPAYSESDAGNGAATSLAERVNSLTPQQLRVLSMLREGLLNKQIAYELHVGNSTIKKHVSEILRKLQVNSRTQAVIEVSKLDQGLFSAESGEFANRA